MPINQIHLSAAIITLNEEQNIGDCIKSLDWVDEIVVVDSLSTDNTKKVAKSLGAKVIDQAFLGHVKQKQLAVDSCSHDWIICLDADERITADLKKEIIQLFTNTPVDGLSDGYTVARKSFHLGKWIMHGGWYPDRNIRLFNRKHGRWTGLNPHDVIEVRGKPGRLEGALQHFVFEDLAHNIRTNNSYSSISAKILFESGKKPSLPKLLFKPLGKFIETYFLKRGFLDGLPGFIISIGAAYSMFLKHAKHWEYYHIKKNGSHTK
ncbi:glycosyltransferase family 2 protein [bacterium]|nr:glycosyltransferase family 2 protein [bacterium]